MCPSPYASSRLPVVAANAYRQRRSRVAHTLERASWWLRPTAPCTSSSVVRPGYDPTAGIWSTIPPSALSPSAWKPASVTVVVAIPVLGNCAPMTLPPGSAIRPCGTGTESKSNSVSSTLPPRRIAFAKLSCCTPGTPAIAPCTVPAVYAAKPDAPLVADAARAAAPDTANVEDADPTANEPARERT